MNTFAKVLVIFILLLSAGFALSQMMLYSKREKYREMYEKADKNYNTQLERANGLDQQNKDLTRDLEGVKNDFATYKDDKEEDTKRLNTNINKLTEEKSKADDKFNEERIRANKQADTIQEKDEYIRKVEQDNNTLKDDLRDRLTDIEKLKADVRAKGEEIASLKENVLQLEADNAEVTQERNRLERILGTLRDRGIYVDEGIVEVIDASVAQADNDLGAVVLDKGRKDGVRINFPFTIYRGGAFVAKVRVVDVHENYSLARIEEGMSRYPMRVGDSATTRLQ